MKDHAVPSAERERDAAASPGASHLGAAASRPANPVARILALQRSAGNAAVARMLARTDDAPAADPSEEEAAAEAGAVLAEEEIVLDDTPHTLKAVVEGDGVELWVHSGTPIRFAALLGQTIRVARTASISRGAMARLTDLQSRASLFAKTAKGLPKHEIREPLRALALEFKELRKEPELKPIVSAFDVSFASEKSHDEIARELGYEPSNYEIEGMRIYVRRKDTPTDRPLCISWDRTKHLSEDAWKVWYRATPDKVAKGAPRDGTWSADLKRKLGP